MIRPEILPILCCPASRQPLRLAESALVKALNRKIAAHQLRNRSGKPVESPMEGGLITTDRQWLYPIRNGIPVLLVGEALPLRD